MSPKILDTVKEILEQNKEARDDDFILIADVYDKLRPELRFLSLDYALRNHKYYNLPSFASIVRARRKLQVTYPHLGASNEAMAIRCDEEDKYRAFAKE